MANDPQVPGALNPQSMSVQDFALMLSAAGGKKITPEPVMADLEAGAPCLPDGRINLVFFTAWLLREVQRR